MVFYPKDDAMIELKLFHGHEPPHLSVQPPPLLSQPPTLPQAELNYRLVNLTLQKTDGSYYIELHSCTETAHCGLCGKQWTMANCLDQL